MIETLVRHWWVLALRGLCAVLFGLLALVWPGMTLIVLVMLFGAYALVDGICALVTAFRDRRSNDHWWVLLLEGIAGIAAGVMTFFWPGMTGLVLLYLIAAWAIVTGIVEIIAAVRLRREITGEWLLALGGLASIVFGVILLVRPLAGALAVAWLIGIYAIVFGVIIILLAFRLRRHRESGGVPSTA